MVTEQQRIQTRKALDDQIRKTIDLWIELSIDAVNHDDLEFAGYILSRVPDLHRVQEYITATNMAFGTLLNSSTGEMK